MEASVKTSDKDLNKNSTIQRILDLLEKKNIKQKELANYLGISTSIFTNWKYRNGNSYMNYLDKIATFLNVSPAYLINGEITADNELTNREEKFLKIYREIDEKSRQMIDHLLEYIVSQNTEVGKI